MESVAETAPAEPPKVKLVTEIMTMWQSLQVARRNLLEIIPQLAVEQNIVSGRTGVRWHMLMDPSAIRVVLKDRLEDYPKSLVTKNMLRPAIGDSLFIAEGAHWRWQRRAAAPVFQHRNIVKLAPIMTAAADACAERLAQKCPGEHDLFQEMVTATFDVIGDVTFSGSGAVDRDEVHHAIEAYINQAAKLSLFDVLGMPDWVPRPGRLFSGSALKRMKKVADGSVESRRQTGPRDVPDLLDLLLAGEDPETKRQMNSSELRDNLLTFIVAGHETTALTLSWALYLCAFDPAVQDKIRAEANDVLDAHDDMGEAAQGLIYTQQVIEETLRLYPPAAFLSRTAQKPDVLCGREIRKGDTVMLPIYALHRNKLLWDRPDEFDPDRFAPGHGIDRYQFLPFGDGPRICIGSAFAMMEAKLILAQLLRKYRFSRMEGKDPKPVMILTLRPEGGVRLMVEPV